MNTFQILAIFTAFTSQLTFAASIKDLSPVGYSTQQGGSGGQPVSAMKVMDQSGTADDASKYVTFTTPSSVYQGERAYQLPPTVLKSWVTGVQVRANYKGDTAALQTWTWWVYDWVAAKWVKFGDNTKATLNTWTLLSFSNTTNPQRFISGTGKIRVKFNSNNATDNAKIDYEAVRLTYVVNSPTFAGCPMFPANNIWNTRIDTLPVHQYSNNYVNTIGATTGFHMDFGSGTWDGGPIGIPYNVVLGTQPKVPISFYYADESDPGPYPIPSSPKIEWGSDHHLLIVDKDRCLLYETYNTTKTTSGTWRADSGAIFHLNSNALRPAGWTSADAAGLPILPGLVRYNEVAAGAIKHAIRFTASQTNGSYLWPARHKASSLSNPAVYPPMGTRFRLKAGFNVSTYPPRMQVILNAMKKYGIILADNGSDWFVSGVPDSRWNNDELHLLDTLKGNNFEAVDESSLMIYPNSGAAKQP